MFQTTLSSTAILNTSQKKEKEKKKKEFVLTNCKLCPLEFWVVTIAKIFNTQYLMQIFLSYALNAMLLSEVNLGPDPASIDVKGSRAASFVMSVSYTGLAAHPVFFSVYRKASEINVLTWYVVNCIDLAAHSASSQCTIKTIGISITLSVQTMPQ